MIMRFAMKPINYIMYDSLHIRYIDERDMISQKMDYFKQDYEYFRVDNNDPNVIIKISKFDHKKNNYLIENDEYIINRGYLSGKKSYKVAKFEYSIEKDALGIININVNPNFFANLVFPHLLLDHLINLMLFHKGYSNLHCSGIEKNQEAILLSGPGGAGKTSFALYCLSKGYRLLGDDRIFLKNSIVYPFPECPGVEFNNSRYIKKFLNPKVKLLILLNKMISIVSLNYIGALFPMKSLDVFPKNAIGKESKVKSIIFLQPSNKFEVKTINREEIVKKLCINQLFEDRHMLRETFNYSTAFPKNGFIGYINSYSDCLDRNLPENLKGYSINFPKNDYESLKIWLDGYI